MAHHQTGKPSFLSYLENIIVDCGGCILASEVTHASVGERKAMPELFEQLPISPVSLAADAAYSAGQSRHMLEERGSRPTFPSTESRRTRWPPRRILHMTASTWFAGKARRCTEARG